VSSAPFVIRPLASDHDRASFTCGVEPLDRYFRHQASQDSKRRIANCFVAQEVSTGAVAGYYTLSATNVLLSELPETVTRRLPRYAAVSAALLGRLAVASAFQGRKLGTSLLADALSRAALADIATFAMLVDPKDDSAHAFYERHGFISLPAPERRMFLPIESALRYLRAEGKG
jgi:predicted N-acetyltransferase YhbS